MRLIYWLLLPAALSAAPLDLSLKRAVELALSPEGSARVRLAEEAIKQSEARGLQARAALLPDLGSQFTVQNLTRNLAAMGISIAVPIPGVKIPTFVGPFTTMDARVSATQSIFDLSSIRRFQAAKILVGATRSDLM